MLSLIRKPFTTVKTNVFELLLSFASSCYKNEKAMNYNANVTESGQPNLTLKFVTIKYTFL